MKTTRTKPHPSQTSGNDLRPLIIILVIVECAFLPWIFASCMRHILGIKIYSSEEKVLAIYEENREDFDALAGLLLEKDELFQYLYDERDSHSIPDLRGLDGKDHPCRDYFSDEERDFLGRFVEAYKPNDICRLHGLAIEITFRISDGSAVLCYIPRDEQGTYREVIRYIQADSFTNQFLDLGDDWYLRVSSRS